MSKEQVNARTDKEVIIELQKIAKEENRTYSNLVDTILKSFIANRQKSIGKNYKT